MRECAPDRTNIARNVLAYLSGHPDAADTVEGVSGRWLAGALEGRESIVKEVLEDLVTQGLLEKVPGSNGRTVYRRHRRSPAA